MTFTYSGDPENSDIDTVRYLIGDTDSSTALVSNQEIQYSIDRWYDLYGTLEWVSAEILDTLAARYAREPGTISADGVTVSLSGLQEQFAAQADRLRRAHRDTFVGAQVDVGGVTPGEGTDPLVKPFAFGKGMHDNLSAGRQDYGGHLADEYWPEEQPGV